MLEIRARIGAARIPFGMVGMFGLAALVVLPLTLGSLAGAAPDKGKPAATKASVKTAAKPAATKAPASKPTPAGAAKGTGAAKKNNDAKPAETAKEQAAPETTEELLARDGEKLAPVLPAEQFFGAAAMGYTAAKIIPHVCSKIFCYCGCDVTDSHNCLLDCYTSMHGADCHICQEEAMQALRMSRDNTPLATIQKTIDDAFQSKYPFKEESKALKNYRATRTYSPTGQTPAGGATQGEACCAGK